MPEENSKVSMSRWATSVRFETFQYRECTYFIRLKAYYTCEPWDLYAALEGKGFVKTTHRPKDKEGYITYRFSRRGSLRNGLWDARERRSCMRTATGILRRFGFDRVQKAHVYD